MQRFPDFLNAKAIEYENYEKNFYKYNLERIVKNHRKEICDLIISREDENNYLDIDLFSDKNFTNIDTVKEVLPEILSELKSLGWNTKLSFGDTGLFIYSSDNTPPSCW